MRRASAALAMRAARAVPGMRHGTIAADAAAGGAEEASRVAANRLLYRASQRGLLELDIIIGKWTAEHVKGLDGEGRRHLTDLLALENPDLLNWLTGRAPPPADVAANPVFRAMAAGVEARLAAAPPATRAAGGTKWVDAWQDLRRDGNQ